MFARRLFSFARSEVAAKMKMSLFAKTAAMLNRSVRCCRQATRGQSGTGPVPSAADPADEATGEIVHGGQATYVFFDGPLAGS